MIEYIRGILRECSPSHAVIETQGIGYKLLIPLNNFSKLPQIEKEAILFVSTVIREDAHKSFGFLTRLERDFFEKLTEVSGIGPKTALALIGHMEISDLQLAITQSNISLLSKVPGIGKKTAERLVVELKDKTLHGKETPSSIAGAEKGLFADALSALINLGYNPMQAQKNLKDILSKANEQPDLASLITQALRTF
ncbi:MAG: Holliday junction branch migration protein RuvA [Chlamydiae bacterium]|nr:Holliday junction branch migration protein RuvA [Chlamydiota bacterium]